VTTAAAVAARVSGNVDYTPWLDGGADTSVNAGFQGSFDILHVAAASPQTSGLRIQEAIDLATGPAPTVIVEAGTYTENVLANKAGLVLKGATGVPGDVVLTPPGGVGVNVSANNVTIRDLRITTATTGIVASGVTPLTLIDLMVDGNGAGGTLTNVSTVNFTATPGADTIDVSGTQFDSSGVQPLAFTGVSTLNLFGDTGNDVFNVTPAATGGVSISIDGGAPTAPASPGDTLNYDATGVTSLSTASPITANGKQSVSYTNIETLNVLNFPFDLAVTVSAGGVTTTTPGATVTYAIVVTNNGPNAVSGATLSDLFPAAFSGVTFTSVAAGGASGNTTSGSGSLNETLSLPSGASVTYTVTARLTPSFVGMVTNSATVTPPAGLTDSNPATNTAADTLAVNPDSTTTTLTVSPTSTVFGQSVTLTATVTAATAASGTPTGMVTFNVNGQPVATVMLVNGTATTTFAPTSTGSFTVTASFGGATPFAASSSAASTLTVAKADTTVALTTSSGSAVAGTPVTLTATVSAVAPGSGTPTGTVDFFSNGQLLGSATLTNGTATLSTALPAGADTITATYEGDANFNTATSPPVTVQEQSNLPGVFAVGAGPGGQPVVNVYDAATGAFKYQFQAFETGFTGGVRVAVSHLNGLDFIAVAAGPGGFLVRTFVAGDSGVTPVGQITPFGTFINGVYQGFTGGIFVALGDLNNDGNLEVVTSPDQAPNSDPFLNVWSLDGKVQISGNVYAFEKGFHGGVRVAIADVDGDGKNEILAAAGPNGLPYVQVINGQTFADEARFEVFDDSFRGGVFVTGAVLDAAGLARLVVSADGGDGSPFNEPVVREYDGTGHLLHDSVLALEASYHGGIDVASSRAFGATLDTILVGPVRPHRPTVVALDAKLAVLPDSFTVLDPKTGTADANFSDGLDVG
jgi:hypothetical protein